MATFIPCYIRRAQNFYMLNINARQFLNLFLQLDEFLSKMDDPNYWRTVRDKATGKEIVLSDEQIDAIQNLQKSKFPVATTDPYKVSGCICC